MHVLASYNHFAYPYDILHLFSLFIYIILKRLYLVCVAYLRGSHSRLKRSQIRRPLSNDLVVLVYFEDGQESRLCFLDQLLLVLLELELFISRQGIPSRLYNIAWGDVRAIS
jgi:hypothetical protein